MVKYIGGNIIEAKNETTPERNIGFRELLYLNFIVGYYLSY